MTTKTPMHGTKLSFWKWLQAIYFIVNSSKGISSVILAQWIGVSQPTAWRMGHAFREMMIPTSQSDRLTGIVELDEKYFGGKPRYQPGVTHKRGKGTYKKGVCIAAQHSGPFRAVAIDSEKVSQMQPIIDQHISKVSHLMSDGHQSYLSMGKQFFIFI